MSDFKFTLWDVKHGLAIWVKTPNGQNHWIDLGSSEEFSPSKHVSGKYGVTNIDYLIISHPDQDHLTDLPSFLEVFGNPGAMTFNHTLPSKEKHGNLTKEHQKKFKYLSNKFNNLIPNSVDPQNPSVNGGIRYRSCALEWHEAQNRNNTSVVTALEYNGILILVPGDIEPGGWKKLWDACKDEFNDLIKNTEPRILIAPHHGRRSAYSRHMMDVLDPSHVIVSDKWGKSETHPEYHRRAKRESYSTKKGGRILVEVSSRQARPTIQQFSLTDNV